MSWLNKFFVSIAMAVTTIFGVNQGVTNSVNLPSPTVQESATPSKKVIKTSTQIMATPQVVSANIHLITNGVRNTENPNIMTDKYYYPTGIITNTHSLNYVSSKSSEQDVFYDYISNDNKNLNSNPNSPIFTRIIPSSLVDLSTGYKVLLAEFIQTNGRVSDEFWTFVIFDTKDEHEYFPINTYVGKYKDDFVGPFLDEQASFQMSNGNIILNQTNAQIGQTGTYHRTMTFVFKNPSFNLVDEQLQVQNTNTVNKGQLKTVPGGNSIYLAP